MYIAIVRNVDNAVMNDREGSDWKYHEKLVEEEGKLAALPPGNPDKQAELEAVIAKLQASKEQWYLKRRQRTAKQFGGVASDYSIVYLPEEITLQEYYSARYITYDGIELTLMLGDAYTVVGSVITCHPGWVKGNERLLTEDVTDWSSEVLTEPVYFELWYARNNSTQEISVQLLTRQEDEEFSALPGTLTRIGQEPICQGRVDTDNSIIVGG